MIDEVELIVPQILGTGRVRERPRKAANWHTVRRYWASVLSASSRIRMPSIMRWLIGLW